MQRFGPAILTSLLFAGSFGAARVVTLQFQPLSATLFRYIVALAFLAALLPIRRPNLRVRIGDVPQFLLLGFFGIAGYHFFFFLSVRFTEVANTAIINGLSPAVTAVLAALLIGERLARRQIAGVALVVAGVTVLVSNGDIAALVRRDVHSGDALMLVAVLCWAAYAIRIPKLSKRYSILTITLYATVSGVAILLVLPQTWTETPVAHLRLSTGAARWAIVYMGVAASGIGYLLYNASITRIGPSRTAAVVYGLVPIWVSALGWIAFGEPVTVVSAVSVLLVGGGLALTR